MSLEMANSSAQSADLRRARSSTEAPLGLPLNKSEGRLWPWCETSGGAPATRMEGSLVRCFLGGCVGRAGAGASVTFSAGFSGPFSNLSTSAMVSWIEGGCLVIVAPPDALGVDS